MSAAERLAQLAGALEEAGLNTLVMGGHAVRYYGVDRNTVDFDFYTDAPSTKAVRERLAQSALLKDAREGPSWRPEDFTRFEIGRLPDGREEWLEFWLRNHLLSEFAQLRGRQELGRYGGRDLPFISLPDLLRSKETEREGDWHDIALLEEVQDSRNIAAGNVEVILGQLRSQRGFDRAKGLGLFEDHERVRAIASRVEHPVTFAYLRPLASQVPEPPSLRSAVDLVVTERLKAIEFGAGKHSSLVEIVRRAYKRGAMELDRRDKQSRLKSQ